MAKSNFEGTSGVEAKKTKVEFYIKSGLTPDEAR